MSKDLSQWVESLLDRLPRKQPRRVEALPTKPTDCECWEEIVVDMEGPQLACRRRGAKHVMTYVRMFLRRRSRSLARTRRLGGAVSLFRRLFRSGTLPRAAYDRVRSSAILCF